MAGLQITEIRTCMGKVINKVSLSFLSKEELEDLDLIGYTGRDSSGKKISRKKYLNSLGKGEFEIVQSNHDTGGFCESFTLVRYCVAPPLEKNERTIHANL